MNDDETSELRSTDLAVEYLNERTTRTAMQRWPTSRIASMNAPPERQCTVLVGVNGQQRIKPQ